MIVAILVSWLLCFIFTVTDVFPPDSTKYGFYARTDARQGVLLVAPWFKVPYPCKYFGSQEGSGSHRGLSLENLEVSRSLYKAFFVFGRLKVLALRELESRGGRRCCQRATVTHRD